MLAPPELRPDLFVLLAFNHELVRAVEMRAARSGAGPMAAMIRLQWWRDVVENSRPDWVGHEVAAPLRALLDRKAVEVGTLLRLIDAREAEAEGLATVEAWRAAMRDGAGGLARAMAERVGLDATLLPRVALAGAAYGCGAMRRHLPALLRADRATLPEEMLREAGLDSDREEAYWRVETVTALREALRQEGERFRDAAGTFRLPRKETAPVLPLVLAARDLRADATDVKGARGLGDRLAVLRAALSGKVG